MAARIIFSAVVAGAIASVLLAIASTREQAAVGTVSAAGSALPALGAGPFMAAAPKATQLWLTVSARSQQRVCPRANALPGYAARVRHALQAKRDLWGEELLHAPNGPTFEDADRHLAPLVYADRKRGRRMTQSGVYYLPFSSPTGQADNVGYALHVADGSEIITRRIRGRSLELFVGHQGRERYGACRARLAPARLAAGYLPILETSYIDAGGVRYRQESFVGSTGGKSPFVSFVHVVADAREADAGAL